MSSVNRRIITARSYDRHCKGGPSGDGPRLPATRHDRPEGEKLLMDGPRLRSRQS